MRRTALCFTVLALVAGVAADALAQGMPTTQPSFLYVVRESVKPGRAAEHAKWEAGWPAAFEKAKSKNAYIGMSSLTGSPEAWFIMPYASQAAYGESLAEEGDPVLGPELERLSRGDAEFITGTTAMQAVAMPDLSQGAFPDISKARFYEVTTVHVKPGYYDDWVAAAKAMKAAYARSASSAAWRVYAVLAGAPGDTFLVMSTAGSFAEFDKAMAEGEAIWKAMPAADSALLTRFFKEGVADAVTQRFRIDPLMSYVDAATKAKDPFWSGKK